MTSWLPRWFALLLLVLPFPVVAYAADDKALDTPTQRISVSVPHQPGLLAWSTDGAYVAAGASGWGSVTEKPDPGEVYVVDVAKASVTTTLRPTGWVQGLAFSPDGKWLAVATTQSDPAGAAPAELVVFDVPAFTAKFTAKAGGPKHGYLDLAWAADSKALHAIDSRGVSLDRTTVEKAAVRRWVVPAFTEQPAIPAVKTGRYAALTVSPDGRTLAVADDTGLMNDQQVVRLFDLGSGAERSSFKIGSTQPLTPRLGYSPDGKAVGVFEQLQLSWWDVGTGRPTKPDPARIVIPPAGLRTYRHLPALSPDGSRQANGYEVHPRIPMGLNDILLAPKNTFGTFVRMTASATAKTWTWRVGEETQGYVDAPPVAFSPDGTKLAATVKQQDGGSVLIWAVPK